MRVNIFACVVKVSFNQEQDTQGNNDQAFNNLDCRGVGTGKVNFIVSPSNDQYIKSFLDDILASTLTFKKIYRKQFTNNYQVQAMHVTRLPIQSSQMFVLLFLLFYNVLFLKSRIVL
jgi:hypothetical protein